jgi:hypothetical protein
MPQRPTLRDLAIVLAVSWLARGLFVVAIGDVHSMDVDLWRIALDAQDEGRNPYETGVLNWPPLWLVVIVGLDDAANLAGVSFLSALRLYLVLVESVLVVTLYLTLVGAEARRVAVRRALLVGIALNPIAILLVCQHGNSDVQVGLLVTLAASALLAHGRSRDVVLWLTGCLLLGLGVLAKTVPLVLVPLLAPGARMASTAGKVLGGVLLLGPAALGVGVILALAPQAVVDHVLGYRSTRGFFGVSGLLDVKFPGDPAGRVEALTGIDVRAHYPTLFALAVVGVIVWLGRKLWGEPPLAADRLFLLVAVVLMATVAVGPVYGPQYAYWFLPALVATYVLLDDAWRRLLLAGYVVAVLTYAIEYAFVMWLGAYAKVDGAGWRGDVSEFLNDTRTLTLFRLPLFAVYLVIIAAGLVRLLGSHAAEPREPGSEAR